MKIIMRNLCALMLVLACVPLFADDCPAIAALTANDVQTGEPVTVQWSYTGGAPQTQTLTGHDFETPVLLGPDVRSYTYTPSKPGEKQVQLAATSSCGTVTTSAKYKVKQCNVVAAPVVVDQTSVAPGAVIHASLAPAPGQTVRWEVTNGTASATTGSAIQVTAGGAGTVVINAWVSRGSSCAVLSTATVEVVPSCPIVEPQVYHPAAATSDYWFYLYVPQVGPGESFTFAAQGAPITYQDEQSVYVHTPSQGSFSIDVIVTNGTCTRTFTYSFTVAACNASAIVKPGQSDGCGYTTAIAEFSGTAPFQGWWSDGESFFTYESTLEHPTSGGNLTLTYFYDQYCQGSVTGSVQGGAFPVPAFTIDPIVDGYYWGDDTCPGTVRTATLDGGDIPAGATLEWSIPGGTIVSGQGTPVVQYAGGEIGPTRLTAVFHDAQGCSSAPYVQPYGQTMAAPQVSVSVEPATIPAGGTAVVTVAFQGYFTGGFGVSSSLGDTIVPLANGQFEYRSTNGGGVATLTATASNACATSTATTTLTIDGAHPVQGTAKVQALGSSCPDFLAYAEFTGVPPFTGTWSNGETFTTTDSYFYLRPEQGGTYTLVAFADANGPGTVTGSATFDFTRLPQPAFQYNVESTCPNSVVTATLTTPLPEGATASWYVYYGELISGQGTTSIQIRAGESGWVGAGVFVTAPDACSTGTSGNIPILSYAQQPLFDLYGVYVGGTTQFDVYLDPNTASWNFENSFGDPMEIIGNPQPNVYTVRYTSTHGFGDSSVRVYGTTACGVAFENTRVMPVLPPAPTVTLTSAPGETCGTVLTATFTGTGPFSGTWWDGQTFTTNESTITRFLGGFEYVYVYDVHDTYGGNAQAGFFFTDPKRPDPVPIGGATQVCLGQQTTVTADLPPGWTILWRVAPDPADLSYGLRIVSGETSATVVLEGVIAEQGILNPVVSTPEGCLNYQTYYVNVTDCGQQ